MAENEAKVHAKRRTIRLPPAIPFLWEDRPGIAKKDWKPPLPSSITTTLPPPTPIKLIASVPFNWEEKPGTPLPYFSQTSVEQAAVFEMYHEPSGFETDDSFSSAPSTAVSTILPMHETYRIDDGGDLLETPSSPASETDSISSYATGASSLVGASFLECLFPLLPPNIGFNEKVRYPDQESRVQSGYGGESNNSVVIRRPATLGELIMMSRRRSYQRKAAQIRQNQISMEFLKERVPGCCIFGSDNKIIEGLQLKKFQPRLKFF